MAEDRALKLSTKGDYIRSGQSNDKSPLKRRGFAHVTHFLYAQLWSLKKSPLHSVTAINRVVDDGYRLSLCRLSHLRRSTLVLHTLRLSSIGSIFHRACWKLACIIYRQQINQVEFEHYRSNML